MKDKEFKDKIQLQLSLAVSRQNYELARTLADIKKLITNANPKHIPASETK